MFAKRALKYVSVERGKGWKNERGFLLVSTLLFLALFTILGMMLMYKVTSTIKISGLSRMEMTRFHGAEGGALSVAAYMTQYRRTDPPEDVTITDTREFEAGVTLLGDSIRYPVGYSTLWKGGDVQINSVSPPTPDDKSEVELAVFIPVSPVGYGNE